MNIDHWMIFSTFAEQDYFIYPTIETYKGVIINGNMATYAPDGLAAFLLEKTKTLNYIIDPLTHAFQHDPSVVKNSKDEVKTSILGLANQYGPPFDKIVGERPLLPRDLADENIIKSFVENCLNFQKNKLSSAMLDSDANKYLDYTKKELEPYALIIPYFYLTETTIDSWLPLQAKFAIYSKEICSEFKPKLFTSIVISKGIIRSDEYINQIVKTFSNIELDGFIIWVDDFDEHKSGRVELEGLLKLARGLQSKPEIEVINLHGGYFSILAAGILGEGKLSGVAHGPEFGEYRPVIPVGGGIPIAKYYIPILHNRIKFRDSLRYFSDKNWLQNAETFYSNVCGCDVCKKILKDDPTNFTNYGLSTVKQVKRGNGFIRMEFPSKNTKQNCLRHYLERKAIEYDLSQKGPKEEIIEDINKGITEFEDLIGLEGIGYLKVWKSVLGID